jgi:competence protein ComEC
VLAAVGIVIIGIMISCIRKNKKMWRVLITISVLAAMAAGFVRSDKMQQEYDSLKTALCEQTSLTVQGKLIAKDYKNNQYIYQLSSCIVGLNQTNRIFPVTRHRILVSSSSDILSIGTTVVLKGTTALWKEAHNEGNFDEKSYYEAQGIALCMEQPQLLAVYGKPDGWREFLWELKQRWRKVYEAEAGDATGGILATMVLGDKTLLDTEVKRLYQICGISHILAISGLHISVLGVSVYRFLRRCSLRFWQASVLAAGIMYSYGTMIGMGTSVHRAIVMFVLMLGAETAGRGYDSFNALGLAGIILLWNNPMLLWDAGFQFSFVAVSGAVWASGMAQSGRRLRDTCVVTGAIQLATLPLAVWYYYEIPTYAVLLNLLILPATGVILGIGILGGMVGMLWLGAGHVLLLPARILLNIQLWVCEKAARLPGAMFVTGKPLLWQLFLYYGLLLALAVLLRWKNKKIIGKKAVEAGIAIALLVLLCLPKIRGLEIDVLDVGQGDGIYLHTAQGMSLFVDGGSSDVSKVGTYRILPFLKAKGVRKIDYWFVSHTDNDHISGLKEVVNEGYSIGCLVAGVNQTTEDSSWEELLKLAKQQGIEVLYLKAGDKLRLGTAAVSVLSPVKEQLQGDENEDSLVLYYEENGFSGIFTGDIGAATEQKLIEHYRLQQISFYKAAHHGSKYSNTAEFLNRLSPEVAVVSCGSNNSYGHPSKEAVTNMEAAGAEIYYTMKSGQIKITVEGEEIAVLRYLH